MQTNDQSHSVCSVEYSTTSHNFLCETESSALSPHCLTLCPYHSSEEYCHKIGAMFRSHFWQLRCLKIGKFWRHKSCKNWQVLSVAKIGKHCWLPNLANFEDTKVAKIGIWTYLKIILHTAYLARAGKGTEKDTTCPLGHSSTAVSFSPFFLPLSPSRSLWSESETNTPWGE